MTNEEKQIEELAEDIKEILVRNFDKTNLYHWVTKDLYTKGYRKASDVAREVIGKLEQEISKCFRECFKWEGNTTERREMLNYNAHIKILLAEFKKKYVSEENKE